MRDEFKPASEMCLNGLQCDLWCSTAKRFIFLLFSSKSCALQAQLVRVVPGFAATRVALTGLKHNSIC